MFEGRYQNKKTHGTSHAAVTAVSPAALLRCAFVLIAVLFAALISSAASAQAQYPNKTIRIIVTIPPGGAPDLIARLFGQKLSEAVGQPVVIENRVGANGYIGADVVAKSAPDGYTLLLAQDSIFVINPHLYSGTPVVVGKDLVAVGSAAGNPLILAVPPSLPVKTLPEFVEYARKANPALQYSSAGNGSQHHLTMELLKSRAGIKLEHIPYKGGVPAAQATMTGEVAATIAGASASQLFTAGRLRPIAVTGAHRMAQFPDLPTIAETYPGFDMGNWYGLFAPAGTPAPVLARLRTELANAMQAADVKEKLKGAGGIEPWLTKPEEFNAKIKADYEKFGKLVKETGAKTD
jgi:tripartite-type tricarboxylate transporter receptor subunit TctC